MAGGCLFRLAQLIGIVIVGLAVLGLAFGLIGFALANLGTILLVCVGIFIGACITGANKGS